MIPRNDAHYNRMIQMPVHRLIIRLAIPTIFTMLITSVYNLADTAFVGQLGNSASGAVGVVFGFMAILQALAFMIGQGSGSILSRMLGRKDYETASGIASTGFFLAFSIAVIISICGFIFLDPLVYMLGSTVTIAPYAKTYISFILISCPFIVTSFVMNNILRYEGKAMLGMIGMMTGAILNILLDPIFMFVLGMGIAGAGLATALTQVIGFLILLRMFLTGKSELRLSIKRFIPNIRTIADIFATGLPSLLRQGLMAIATMILNIESAPFGDEAVAAMSIVSRIVMFVFSIAIGVGQGFQPVSAFNYGAGRFDRVRSSFWFTFMLSESFLIIAVICVNIDPHSLVRIFRNDDNVISIAVRALRLQSFSLLLMPIGMVTEMLLQTTGWKVGASLLSALRSGLLFIPATILLSHFRGLAGIQEAQAVTNVISMPFGIIYLILFFQKMRSDEL